MESGLSEAPQTAAAWGMRQPVILMNHTFIVKKLTSFVNLRFI